MLAWKLNASCIEPVNDLKIFVISVVHGNMEFSLPPTTCAISDTEFGLFTIYFDLDGKMSKPIYLSSFKVLKEEYIEGEAQWLRFPYPSLKGTHFYYIRAFSEDGTVTKMSNLPHLCLYCEESKIQEEVSDIKTPQFDPPKLKIPKIKVVVLESEKETVKDKAIQKLIKYGLMGGALAFLACIGCIIYKCIKCRQSRRRRSRSRQISYPTIQPKKQNQEQGQEQKEIKVDMPKLNIENGSDSKDQEDSKDEEHQPFVTVQYFRVVPTPTVSTSYRGGGDCDFDFD